MRPHGSSICVLLALTCAGVGLGCPADVERAPRRMGATEKQAPVPTPDVDEDDPRVLKEDEDLYAAEAVARTKDPEREGPAPGSGKPDESNGVCRLYAPKLPEPECCAAELGFDAKTVAKACGLDVYLGESFQASCGYYFHDADHGSPVWFRTSFVDAPDAKTAAERSAMRLRKRQKIADAKAQKVPGVTGAFWVRAKGLAWAFIPGWKKVRQLAWRETFCEQDAVEAVIAQLAAAKPPGPRDKRLGLVPKARM